MANTKYKRVLLKLSGEALMGETGFGIDPDVVRRMAAEIKDVHHLGVQIAVVIGGGNIFRGLAASAQGFDRISADHSHQRPGSPGCSGKNRRLYSCAVRYRNA